MKKRPASLLMGNRALLYGYYELWMQEDVQGSQYQGNCAQQLNQNVERWAGSILERITDGVANHACLVRLTLLPENRSIGVETINHLTLAIYSQVTSFDVLLGIVPRATTV